MLVMNKLLNTLQGKNPECLAQLQNSTAVQAPAIKEVPSVSALRNSQAIVASRMGDATVLEATVNEEVVEPAPKKQKVMTCQICKKMGDDRDNHGRRSDINCPNRDVKPETVSRPMVITAEMRNNGRVKLPDGYWPCQKFSSEVFTLAKAFSIPR